MPDTPVYAIGVTRGQLDAFGRLLDRIEDEAYAPRYARARIVLLGDLLAGQDSPSMLAAVAAAERASQGQLQVIMGQHDRQLLDFLDNPPFEGPDFLRNGGRTLVTALGIEVSPDVTAKSYRDLAEALRRRLGTAGIAWLAARPPCWVSGNLIFVHAGLDPDKTLHQQSPAHMLSGHPRFHHAPRRDKTWVVYTEPGAAGGMKRGRRIAIGGGLPGQGRIDAVRIAPGEPPVFINATA